MMRVMWEINCDNPDMITLHTDCFVPPAYDRQVADNTEGGGFNLFGGPTVKFTATEFNALVENIHGVLKIVNEDKYSLTITKGSVFDWDEIKPKLVSLVCEMINESSDDVVEKPPTSCNQCDKRRRVAMEEAAAAEEAIAAVAAARNTVEVQQVGTLTYKDQELSVLSGSDGHIFAVLSSYLEQDVDVVVSPYNNGTCKFEDAIVGVSSV